MTQNNYPEGLDELAVKVWDDKPGHIASYEFIKDNARALLDALAERGYVLVDAKGKEAIGEMREGGVVWFGPNPHAFPVGTRFYTHPAIPGRVALPDGWVPVPVEPTEKMTRAAFRIDLSYMPGQEHADRATIYKAMLSAAPTPPTKPQGDGSLRTGAEHEYAIKEGARISACEGYFNARPQIDCLDRRRVFEAGFDRGYDAAMEASNGNA